MKTFCYVDVATGAVSSVVTGPDTVMPGDFQQIAGQALLDWSSYAPIDPLKFNESHWFQATAQGSGSWLLTLQTYTTAQKAAKAVVPDYPAVWSNATMSWQDQRTLQQAKDDKWAAFKAARELMLQAPLEWGGMTFDADYVSQQRLANQVTRELLFERSGTTSPGVEWTLADNTEAHLDAQDVFDVATQLAARTAMVFALFRSARTAIYACTSHAELDAITTPELP